MAGVIARVQVIHEVATGQDTGQWELSLQWCQYVYSNGESEHGYRFIWRRPDGSLQAARGQARIPSLSIAEYLISRARQQGWADLKADDGDGWGDFNPSAA